MSTFSYLTFRFIYVVNSSFGKFSSTVQWQQQKSMKSQYWFTCLYSHLVYSFPNGIYQYVFLTLLLMSSCNCGSESNIICRFAEKNRTFFWTGEELTGNIEFLNSEYKKLSLKRIEVKLIGEFVYGVRQRSSNITGDDSRQEIFFSKKLFLQSSNGATEFVLSYGDHQWPFQFLLDDDLPPSLEQNIYNGSSIRYSLQIEFVRPEWLKVNLRKTIPIVVKYKSTSRSAVQLEAQDKSRKGVIFHVVLQQKLVTAGNDFSFDIDVRNPKKALIRRISMTLIQTLDLDPTDRKLSTLLEKNLEKTHRVRSTHLKENFQLQMPRSAPPTFTFHFPSSSEKLSIGVSYKLQFEVHLRGFFTNIRVQLPLIVAQHSQIE